MNNTALPGYVHETLQSVCSYLYQLPICKEMFKIKAPLRQNIDNPSYTVIPPCVLTIDSPNNSQQANLCNVYADEGEV